MLTMPLSKFRANASATLDLVVRGETVCILRHGKPVAELVPARPYSCEPIPSWKRAIKTVHYLRQPVKSGAEMINEEREDGLR